MKWHRVQSTGIRRIGYDAGRRELGVEFLHGGIYVYARVAEAVFEAFLSAESKGRFFHVHVLDRYPFTRPGQ